jgi:hypothetical protein
MIDHWLINFLRISYDNDHELSILAPNFIYENIRKKIEFRGIKVYLFCKEKFYLQRNFGSILWYFTWFSSKICPLLLKKYSRGTLFAVKDIIYFARYLNWIKSYKLKIKNFHFIQNWHSNANMMDKERYRYRFQPCSVLKWKIESIKFLKFYNPSKKFYLMKNQTLHSWCRLSSNEDIILC